MQILCTWLGRRPRLEAWECRDVSAVVENGPGERDRRDAYEREVARERPGPPEPDGPYRRLARGIMSFRVFPPRLADPVLRREPVAVGDTAGLLYHMAPGLDVFFAARVTACFDEESGGTWRTGFTYLTLPGHPEVGEETFSVEKDAASGRIVVALRSWSRPGILLARVFAPWVRRLQVQAGYAALDQLAGLAHQEWGPSSGYETGS